MLNLRSVLKEYEGAGALNTHIAIHEAIDDNTFFTKSGHLLQMLRVSGVDAECMEAGQVDQIAVRVESALRLLDENFRVYQYLIKTAAKSIEYAKCGLLVVDQSLTGRAASLNTKGLRQIELFWAVVYEGGRLGEDDHSPLSFLKQPTAQIKRLFSAQTVQENLDLELERARQVLAQRVQSLIVQLQGVVTLQLLEKNEAYLVLRKLVNFAPYKAEAPALGYDQFIDFQLCDSALECHRDHLRLDNYYVKVLTLKESPPHTNAHQFREIEALSGNFIMVTEWKREPDGKMRSRIDSMRRHHHIGKTSMLSQLGEKPSQQGEILVNEGSAAVVRELGDAQKELEVSGHHFGVFSTTIVVYGESLQEVRRTSAECIKVYAAKGAHLNEEGFNLLNAFLSIIPGNSAFNLRHLWLSSANAADLSLAYSPSTGESQNRFLNTEHLATLESRQKTPYFLNLHQEDVAHSLVMGRTGSGKSFFLCFLLMQFQKYNPFTFIFDLGGSYKNLTARLGGAYLQIGLESQSVSINPFCLPRTKENFQFLFAFVRVLIESSGYQLNMQDERDLYSQIENLYEIDHGQRRLGTLANILNRPLGDSLGKWIGNGQHGKIFDNVEDNLTLSRFQAFDFDGMDKVAEILEPLLFYVLHRTSAVVNDRANASTLKVFVIDEAWKFFRNPVIRLYILEALKTWRKRNAVMILATQSSDDLLRSEMMATVAESCPTKFFLANPGMDSAAYAQVFHLNGGETEAILSLIPKRELLMKRSDFSKVLQLNVDSSGY